LYKHHPRGRLQGFSGYPFAGFASINLQAFPPDFNRFVAFRAET
jgi:hypothetical protein